MEVSSPNTSQLEDDRRFLHSPFFLNFKAEQNQINAQNPDIPFELASFVAKQPIPQHFSGGLDPKMMSGPTANAMKYWHDLYNKLKPIERKPEDHDDISESPIKSTPLPENPMLPKDKLQELPVQPAPQKVAPAPVPIAAKPTSIGPNKMASIQEAEEIAKFDRKVAFMYGFAKAAKEAGLDADQYAELCKVAAEMTGDFPANGTNPGFMKAMEKAQTPVKAPVISNSGTPAIANTVKAPPVKMTPAKPALPMGAATSDFGANEGTPQTDSTDFMKQLGAMQKKTGAVLKAILLKNAAAGPVQPLPQAPTPGPVPPSQSQAFVSQLVQKLKAGKPAQA